MKSLQLPLYVSVEIEDADEPLAAQLLADAIQASAAVKLEVLGFDFKEPSLQALAESWQGQARIRIAIESPGAVPSDAELRERAYYQDGDHIWSGGRYYSSLMELLGLRSQRSRLTRVLNLLLDRMEGANNIDHPFDLDAMVDFIEAEDLEKRLEVWSVPTTTGNLQALRDFATALREKHVVALVRR